MRYIFALVTAALLSACSSDVVTSNYKTIDDAREGDIFGRGWLPDILPPSTFAIRTVNNLDLNESSGSFSFNPKEYSLLLNQLQPINSAAGLSPARLKMIEQHSSRDRSVWSFKTKQSTWVFYCETSRGQCEYAMWLNGHTPN